MTNRLFSPFYRLIRWGVRWKNRALAMYRLWRFQREMKSQFQDIAQSFPEPDDMDSSFTLEESSNEQ